MTDHSPDISVDEARREFLKKSAAAGVITLAPGVVLMTMSSAAEAKVDPKKRWGMLFDTTKCKSGCDKCVAACKAENGWDAKAGSPTDPQWIRKVDVKDPKTGFEMSLPVMCQHCANPPCVDVCPTGASMKRTDGIVLVNRHICIGCRYCMMACPYKARSFEHHEVPEEEKAPWAPRGQGTVEACTMCVHRVDAGKIPACAEACDKGAVLFGDLNDPDSEISKKLASEPSYQIRADLGVDPGVRYARLP